MKLTEKQENFARVYVETGNASEAYRQAYDTNGSTENHVHVNASKVLADAKVSLRVEELKEKAAKTHNVTVESLLAELEEAKQLAMQQGNAAAATSAIMGKAKITGHDKKLVEMSKKSSINVVVNRPSGD